MTLPQPPALPGHLIPTYATFLESLYRNHNLNISQHAYLRLCLEAPHADVVKLCHAKAATVMLLIQGKWVCCLFEIEAGALAHTYPTRDAPNYAKSRASFQGRTTVPNGGKRKLKTPRRFERRGGHTGDE